MSLDTITHLIIVYRYWILFPLACFEGPLLSVLIGFFISLGYFNPLAAYTLLIFGDIIPDTAYYYVGRFGKRAELLHKYGAKIGISQAHFDVIENLWKRYPLKTMFTSKLAYGLSTAFLISAGIVGMKLRDFLRYAVPITFLQYAILMTIGYYLGNSYTLLANTFQGVEFAIAAFVVAAAAYYAFTMYMRDRVLQTEAEEEKREEHPEQQI